MVITAKEVNELRQQTGAGMMDCKKALVEAEGDFQKAIEILRKKGQKISASRQNREAKEGSIFIAISEDKKQGFAIELNCETDFVGKNSDFLALGQSIIDLTKNHKITSLDALLNAKLDTLTVKEKLEEAMGKIGEKIDIRRLEVLEGELVYGHLHTGGRIGVLVALSGVNGAKEVEAVAKDVAIQITAMNPIAVDKNSVDPSIIEKEIEIGKEQARQEGKPEHILEKIAMGKLEKFFKENTLLAQEFVKDNTKTIQQLLKEHGSDLTVTSFKRLALGS
ncbi:MAG: elongation factor Ts [Bacteroidia bacterium]|nr:MAG: elongation factor Ts [Bacteroidia bacterium]